MKKAKELSNNSRFLKFPIRRGILSKGKTTPNERINCQTSNGDLNFQSMYMLNRHPKSIELLREEYG